MASPIVMPSFGMYTAEGTLVSWLQPAGAAVREGEPILEIETDKATQEVVAPVSGFLHPVLEVGARLQEQMIIGYVLAEGEPPPKAVTSEPATKSSSAAAKFADSSSTSFIKATPMARRLAKEHGVRLETITPTGPGGRIVEKDVLAVARSGSADSIAATPALPYDWRIRERVSFSGMRRTIGDRLKQSQNNAVSLTLTREVSVKKLVDVRRNLNASRTNPIPVDAFFVKAMATALKEHPKLNAVIVGGELLFLDEINIGFAVALPNGINVPVIHGADSLTIEQIAETMRKLIDACRAGGLRSSHIEGGTSTISNLGGHGIDAFTPVLNPPQSTILGIGRMVERPVANGGKIGIEPMVWLSLTFDHRVADGAVAALLLDSLVRHLGDEKLIAAGTS
jgi:pyruvate/2-oxoglutarate dehydrogenase complex dihydrolipoamide acyltransferase (E2) component